MAETVREEMVPSMVPLKLGTQRNAGPRDLSTIEGFWIDKEHKTFLNIHFHDEHTLGIVTWKGHPDDGKYEDGCVESITIDVRTGEITIELGPLKERGAGPIDNDTPRGIENLNEDKN